MNSRHAIWTRPALSGQVLRQRRDGKAEIALHVPSLATSWQALRLEQWLSALNGVARVDVDTSARRIRALLQPAQTSIPALLDACAQAGCAAEPLHQDNLDDRQRQEADDALKHLLVAGIFGMQAMMFALVLYLGVVDAVDTTTLQLFRWLGLLSAAPVVCYAAIPFYRNAWHGLRNGHASIDMPITLAVILIYIGSMITTVRGYGETWFDSASMLVFVLLLGRFLELRARHRHRNQAAAASHAQPLVATRCGAHGDTETVAVAELVAGDRIHVAEGSIVPVDGQLASAQASLDTSAHTGESDPLKRVHGDAIAAGSVALQAPLELLVTRDSAASSLARLHRLTDSARHRHAQTDPEDQLAVTWFMRGLIVLALATAGFWLWQDPSRAMDATIAVLVVACPCAFALAKPTTLTRALSLLAGHRVLVTRPSALLAMARVDRAVFDKTGTLTQPSVNLDRIDLRGNLSQDQAITWALALARESSHPLARALARADDGRALPEVNEVQVVPGRGIHAKVEGRSLQLGRPMNLPAASDNGHMLWLADPSGLLAGFALVDTLRSGSANTLRQLQHEGIAISVASGDAPERVQAVATRLGIHDCAGRQSAEDKYQRVTSLQQDGHAVLVVGDGSNDAPALAAANVSASLIGATDLASQQADLLLEDRLHGLVLARHMARRVTRTLWQNRAWSLSWNTLAVPFAAMGLISPWLAALGMSASSLLVVLNALRMDLPSSADPIGPLHEHPA